jgi:rhodanese-related sulfurtransferase
MNKTPTVFYKTLAIGVTLCLFISISPICVSNNLTSIIFKSYLLVSERNDCPINLTVHEAWELLYDTSNGIQIPVDIRTEDEWNESFIDTPWPEHPRFLGDMTYLEFNETYGGEEVIIYCKGGYRSLLFCYTLCYDTDFNGTVYNMDGGITAWVEEGYPVRNNTPPGAPQIKEANPRAKPLKDPTKNFIFTTIDPDDDKIYLYIDWDDGTFEEWIGPYNSSEEVKLSHTYNAEGNYAVKAKAKDIFEEEGPWGTLEVPIEQKRLLISSFFKFFTDRMPFLEVFFRII